jgi:hypothetical protein
VTVSPRTTDFFEVLETCFVQGGVAEGVISEFETGVEPHVEGFDAFVDFTPSVELAFIHETHMDEMHLECPIAQSTADSDVDEDP